MITMIVTIAAGGLAIASVYLAVLARRRAKWFEASLEFRRKVIAMSTEIVTDDAAPDKTKHIAIFLRVLAMSPKATRKLSESVDVDVKANAGKIPEGMGSRFEARISKMIENVALAAMLGDSEVAPSVYRAIKENRSKIADKQAKAAEVRIIKAAVYQQARDYSSRRHDGETLAAC